MLKLIALFAVVWQLVGCLRKFAIFSCSYHWQ